MPLSTLTSSTALQGSTALTTFKVKADGNLLEHVVSIRIEKGINTIPKAYILFADGNVSSQNFELSEKDNSTPGKKINISVGYNSNEEILFEGEVTKQKVKVTRDNKTRMELVCKDYCYKMALDKKSHYFKDVTEQDILETIVKKYDDIISEYDSLNLSDVSQIKHSSLIQHNISDWDYLMLRLEQTSSFAIVENGVIYVQGVPVYTVASFGLEFGRDVFHMDLELNAENQHKTITSQAWNDHELELIESTSTKPKLPDHGNVDSSVLSKVTKSDYRLKHSGNISSQQLKQWANSKHLRSELSRIKGSISFQGSPKAKLNSYITIGGVSNKFNGPCLITGIAHDIINGNWTTTVQIGLNPFSYSDLHYEKEKTEHLASGSISGFYTGIVTQVHEDPKENNRILVQIPTIQNNQEGSWMRLASLDASEKKGFVNRPDVDDEVVVSFLNNDINQGIIIGALFSKKHPGSDLLSPVEDNNKKGWVLKEKMHLIFDTKDDIVELTTAKGNTILIDQDVINIKDQFKNEIILDSSGISCKTDGNFNITAKGDFKVVANNINMTAKLDLNAKGNTATLNGSSLTKVKGSMVQIN